MPCSPYAKHTLTFGKDTHSDHRDYVPDRKTAERIAEAVLETLPRIKTQGPLLVDESNKDFWIVQVSGGKKGDAHARRRTCGMDQ
jgi:hypothetical protein